MTQESVEILKAGLNLAVAVVTLGLRGYPEQMLLNFHVALSFRNIICAQAK